VASYTPGEAASKTGFTLDTLRYYEKIGLLPAVGRTAGGRRRFTETDIRWLQMLQCLRQTGMPIAQMRRFTELARAGEHTVADLITLLEEHDHHVDKQIGRLHASQEQIRAKIRHYRSLPGPGSPGRP
jgi:DNA-binding transcriptional MerR regulator